MLHAEFFQKTLHFSRNLDFYMFWCGFVWGLYGGGLTRKCWSLVHDLNFWPARHTPRQFSQKAQGTDQLLCAFWTAGFTARPPDIGSAWCNVIFQVSNRTIVCILKRSASLYSDCMEPDHMAKYSLPMLTDLTENLIRKKPTFYVLTPVQFWGCFWTRLGILRSPMWFLSPKSKYWRNYMGGKFCSVPTWATISVCMSGTWIMAEGRLAAIDAWGRSTRSGSGGFRKFSKLSHFSHFSDFSHFYTCYNFSPVEILPDSELGTQ